MLSKGEEYFFQCKTEAEGFVFYSYTYLYFHVKKKDGKFVFSLRQTCRDRSFDSNIKRRKTDIFLRLETATVNKDVHYLDRPGRTRDRQLLYKCNNKVRHIGQNKYVSLVRIWIWQYNIYEYVDVTEIATVIIMTNRHLERGTETEWLNNNVLMNTDVYDHRCLWTQVFMNTSFSMNRSSNQRREDRITDRLVS